MVHHRRQQRIRPARLDVTDTAESRKVVDAAFSALGTIDVVVNNGGYGLFGAAEEFIDEQVIHEIATNLLGSRAGRASRRVDVSRQQVGHRGFQRGTGGRARPFNIGVTVIEPGGARTAFRNGSTQLAPALDAYVGTPAAFVRGLLADETHPSPGEPAKMAAIIIDSADTIPAPKRIVLGSGSYEIIVNALAQRLADIEPQKDLAASTDYAAAADGPR